MQFLFFVTGVAVVALLVHAYFWARLFRDTSGSRGVRVAGAITLLVLASSVFLARWLARSRSREEVAELELVAFVWLGACLFLFCSLAAIDLYRLISWARVRRARETEPPKAPFDPERRRVLARSAAAVAGVTTTGLSGISLRSGLGEVEVVEVPVRLARLPRALDGLTIVQLTDVHVGMATINSGFVERIVEQVNALRADAVVITGDLVDGGVHALAPHVGPLAKLRSRWGTYFVTGNHEYYSGPDLWAAHLERLGITVLRNRRTVLGDSGPGGVTIDLAGVEDPSGAKWGGGPGPDLAQALAGRDPDRSLILLAHQPKQIVEASAHGVELQLSGHTHGGQLFPWGGLVRLTQPYLSGLHTHREGAQIYVSRGTGYWGPPMRLLAPAEITKIVLGVG